MDEQLNQKLKDAHEDIFSFFTTFDEQIESYRRTVVHAEDEYHQSKLILKRIKKLFKHEDPTLHIWLDGSYTEKRKVAHVNFLLPKTWQDYIYGIKLFFDNKSWHNFKCIVYPWMVFPILKIEANPDEEVLELRNIFDITLIQTKDEFIEGSDVVRLVRMWIKKYFPGEEILVQYLKEKE